MSPTRRAPSTSSPHDARKLFACGMSLLFNDVHAASPLLTEWLAAIRGPRAVRADPGSMPGLRDARGQGHRAALRSEHQLRAAAARHQAWSARAQPPRGGPADPAHDRPPARPGAPDLRARADAGAHARGPPQIVLDARLAAVRPARRVARDPRDSDALSLNFTYTAPTWLDLLLAALRAGWRSHPRGGPPRPGLCARVRRAPARARRRRPALERGGHPGRHRGRVVMQRRPRITAASPDACAPAAPRPRRPASARPARRRAPRPTRAARRTSGPCRPAGPT
jgi:hypothetical protein